jgi:ankyrin repeat protein
MVQGLIAHRAEMGLAAAIALQKTSVIKRLMAKDPDGLKPGHRWGTLIVRASEHGTSRIVETLLKLGADANAWDNPKTAVDDARRFTPLHAAATFGNAETAATLLKHGANPAIREERYCGTPAGWANYFGHKQVRDLILQGPIDLFDAIDFNLPGRIEEVTKRDPQALDRPFGEYAVGQPRSGQWWPEPWCTPLMWTAITGNLAALHELLARGAAKEAVTPDGRTLLELANKDQREAVANVLRRQG